MAAVLVMAAPGPAPLLHPSGAPLPCARRAPSAKRVSCACARFRCACFLLPRPAWGHSPRPPSAQRPHAAHRSPPYPMHMPPAACAARGHRVRACLHAYYASV